MAPPVSLAVLQDRAAKASAHYKNAGMLPDSYSNMVMDFAATAGEILCKGAQHWVAKEKLPLIYGSLCIRLVRHLRQIEGRATQAREPGFDHALGFSLLQDWAAGLLDTTGFGKFREPGTGLSLAQAVASLHVEARPRGPAGLQPNAYRCLDLRRASRPLLTMLRPAGAAPSHAHA